MPSTRCIRALLLLILGLLALPLAAQQQQSRDDESRLLDVRRRQIELRSTQSELARTEELYKQGLVSKAVLEKEQSNLAGRQLDYQQAVLAVLNMEPRASIRRAVKVQTRDGRRLVRLTIANLTPAVDDSQFKILSNFEGAQPLPETLRKRDLRDLFISLQDSGMPDPSGRAVGRGTTIGLPYELHLPELAYGVSRTLEFQLLRDVDSVLVAIAQKGQVQRIDLQLEQAATQRIVEVSSAQVSQEADLGAQATFDLRLERATVDMRSLQLRTVGLPAQISHNFLDAKGEARLSQVTFPPGVTQQAIGLRLFLPDRADEQIRIDQPLAFWVVVADDAQAALLPAGRIPTPAELQASKAGLLRLEVIPRGVGRLEVVAGSLFSQIRVGESVETALKVHNTGTRRLDNVQLTARTPLGWRVEMRPEVIPSLNIQQDQDIQLKITPPPDVVVGDYEVRIKAESSANNRQVPSEEKIYRVEVKARSGVWTSVVVLGILLLVVAGVVFAGIKLMRR
jgi:hypothetical protein